MLHLGRAGVTSCLIALGLLGGCAVGPDFTAPTAPNVSTYDRKPTPEATATADGIAQRIVSGQNPASNWWRSFHSSSLDLLVERALANNPSLQSTQATLRQSENQLRAGYGVFYPQAEADLGALRERTAGLLEGEPQSHALFNLATASGTISYALDVFGGERRAVESLSAQTDYQRQLTEAATVTLLANVVNTTIARAAYDAQIRQTQELMGLQTDQMNIAQTLFQTGTGAYSDVLSLQSLVSSDEASLAALEQKRDQTEHLLATLEGQTPAEADLPVIDLQSLTLPADVPLTLPSELVHQRPDILAAEAQLHAASAGIGVATAAMFPSVTLGGTYGVGVVGVSGQPRTTGRFWSFGPSVDIPLFQGGRLWFTRKAAIDAYDAALGNYRQTVLNAFAQVADTLEALQHDAQILKADAKAKESAGDALQLVQANFRSGLVDYPTLALSDIQFHQATIAYLQAIAQREQDTVALFVALGGGWSTRSGGDTGGSIP
ncbi:MAG: efflux transporter outer membrane subunit [Burkholderiaceae bacterium]|jgi:NodT family efflux transporter outer membrane factor (OMF) lipoprotein